MKNLFALLILVFSFTSCSGDFVKVTEATFEDGSPKIVRFYKNDKLEVLKKEIRYYNNGQVRMEGNYKGNLKSGVWKYYYEDGTLWSEGQYKEDQRNGYGITYYANGKKKIKGHYTNGNRSGKWQFYDDKGSLLKEIEY